MVGTYLPGSSFISQAPNRRNETSFSPLQPPRRPPGCELLSGRSARQNRRPRGEKRGERELLSTSFPSSPLPNQSPTHHPHKQTKHRQKVQRNPPAERYEAATLIIASCEMNLHRPSDCWTTRIKSQRWRNATAQKTQLALMSQTCSLSHN